MVNYIEDNFMKGKDWEKILVHIVFYACKYIIHLYELSISQTTTKQNMYFRLVNFTYKSIKLPGDCHGVFHHIGVNNIPI